MSSNKKIVGLIALLAVIFMFIGALVSYDLQEYNSRQLRSVANGDDTLAVVTTTTEAKNGNVLVSDRFTGKLEKDAKVVAVGEDGSMYVVKSGTVLVSDMVVGTNDESISVYRINDPEKSVSTN